MNWKAFLLKTEQVHQDFLREAQRQRARNAGCAPRMNERYDSHGRRCLRRRWLALTVGLKRAGFRVVAAVELEQHAFSTYKAKSP